MKSNTVWKYHLQFLKYFVCQEMNNIIISWKHSFNGKKWFKTNDFLLFLPYSRLMPHVPCRTLWTTKWLSVTLLSKYFKVKSVFIFTLSWSVSKKPDFLDFFGRHLTKEFEKMKITIFCPKMYTSGENWCVIIGTTDMKCSQSHQICIFWAK